MNSLQEILNDNGTHNQYSFNHTHMEQAQKATKVATLYERLGGEAKVKKIV